MVQSDKRWRFIYTGAKTSTKLAAAHVMTRPATDAARMHLWWQWNCCRTASWKRCR